MFVGDKLKSESHNAFWCFLKFEKYFGFDVVYLVLFVSFGDSHYLGDYVWVCCWTVRVNQVTNETSLDQLFESSWIEQIHDFVASKGEGSDVVAQVADRGDSFEVEIADEVVNFDWFFMNFSFFVVRGVPFVEGGDVVGEFVWFRVDEFLFSLFLLVS